MSRKEEWIAAFAKNMKPTGGYPSLIEDTQKEGIFDGWERIRAPGMGDYWLGIAINAASGDYHHPYVQQFLNWSIALCERSLTDPRFEIESENQQKGWKNSSYPNRHGLTLETLAFAQAFRDNAELDETMLIQAAQEQSEYCLNVGYWDYMEQFKYLAYAQLYLILGRMDLVQIQFKTRKKFKQVQRHYDWLTAFIAAIPADGVLTDSATINAFQDYFDEIRTPNYSASKDYKNGFAVSYHLPQLRLQLALMKQRFIIGHSFAGNWEQIIGHISA